MNHLVMIDENLSYDANTCMESWPCQHDVLINGRQETMDGHDICKYCEERGLPVPAHFSNYIDED